MEERLKELLANEEYVRELAALRNPDKISENLAEHDVDISAEEVRTIIKLIKKQSDGELSDEDLRTVAGGFWEAIVWVWIPIVAGAYGIARDCAGC